MRGDAYKAEEMLSTCTYSGLLSINVAAIVENWKQLNRIVSCGAVVKADAYGLGMEPVSCALAHEGCRDFFVALPSEGCELRRALPSTEVRIYVLSGPLDDGQTLVDQHLCPILNSLERISTWQHNAPNSPYGLHIDTGMNRLGLALSDLEQIPPNVNPYLVMSHLACADTPTHPLNTLQRDRFASIRNKFPKAQASLSNSAALFLGKSFLFDLGRPGLALYGGNPLSKHPNPMQTVVTLDLTILQIRTVDTEGTVGYGGTRTVTPGMRLAVASAGYADGLLCTLANQGSGFVQGIRVPVIGRVSMDLITFDISELPEDSVVPGDTICVLGPNYTVDDLAEDADTIPYQILTGLSQRYTRNWRGV